MGNYSKDIYFLKDTVEKYCIKEIFKTPKVSIIVPAYNVEYYVDRCLLSLIKQTLKEIEIIVVNNGSTDNTNSIISLFASSDARVKIIHQNNVDPVEARKAGLNLAMGEFIGFIDADDWAKPNFYEEHYNIVKNNTNTTVTNPLKKKEYWVNTVDKELTKNFNIKIIKRKTILKTSEYVYLLFGFIPIFKKSF